MKLPKYKCAQDVFYVTARAGWRICRKNVAAFAARKPKYTEGYVTERLAKIDEVDYLPDATGRYIDYDLTKLELEKCKQTILMEFGVLLSYIKDAFPTEEVDTMSRAAGDYLLADAKKGNWTKTTALLSAAVPFIEKYQTKLLSSYKTPDVKNNMPADFLAMFQDLQDTFGDLFDQIQETNETGQKQTGEKVELNNALYADLMDMLDDAAVFFQGNKDLLDEFNYKNLKKKAQGTKQAGLKGKVLHPTMDKPVVGSKITLEGTNKTTTTDALGRFDMSQLTEGTYRIIVEADGYETVFIAKLVIKTGKTTRFNIKLGALAMALAA